MIVHEQFSLEFAAYYDRHAESYLAKKNSGLLYFNEAIDIPATLNILSNRITKFKDLEFLDVGCGLGEYSKKLANLGADVTAVDVSERMCDITLSRCEGLRVKCKNENFFDHRYSGINEGYHCVVAGFMLGYFERLDQAFSKFKQVTKKGSIVVTSSIHPFKKPFLQLPEIEDSVEYFNRRTYESDFLDKNEPLGLMRWIPEEVTQAAYDFNFSVDQILEPVPFLQPSEYGDRKLYDHYSKQPSVIIYVLRRR